MTTILKPGARVTWQSQANGGMREKIGEVLVFCPAGEHPCQSLRRSLLSDERGHLMVSRHDRYIVRVSGGPRSTVRRIYTPRAEWVRIKEAGQ